MPFNPLTAQPVGQSPTPLVGLPSVRGTFNPATATQFTPSSVTKPPASAIAGPSTTPWTDVAKGFVTNIPSSAVKTAGDMYTAVRHPIKSAEAFADTGIGMYEKMIPGKHFDDEKYANTFIKGLKDRYGSVEGFKNTLKTDPVGAMTDLASIFTGGEALPGKLGEVSKVAAKATNPAILAGKAVSAVAPKVGNLAADVIGGMGTFTGGDAIKEAFKAGVAGKNASQAFLDNMRNPSIQNMGATVESAKDAVSSMKMERQAAYKAGMAGLSKDKTVMDFKPVDAAMADIDNVRKFKNESLSPSTAAIRKQIQAEVEHWRRLPPDEYHTPVGMDALKQKISDLRNGTAEGSSERYVVDHATKAIGKAIKDQAPSYAKVMSDYEAASDELGNLTKTFSLNEKAATDTSLRKLQSMLRDNVNTSYGFRKALGDELAKHGAPHLKSELAGQALSKMTPRGIGPMVDAAIAAPALFMHAPWALFAAPFASPRIVGEVSHALGSAKRLGSKLPVPKGSSQLLPPAYEAGKLEQQTQGTNQ